MQGQLNHFGVNKNHHSLQELVARVAHDISSPIATIEMSLCLLSKDLPSDNLAIMKAALQNMRDITGGLLHEYRLQQAGYISNRMLYNDCATVTPIFLVSLIETVMTQKKLEWRSKDVEFNFIYSHSDKSITVNTDPRETIRIFSNLLNNAVEACSKPAKIMISLEVNEHTAKVMIEDNGIGIMADKIDDCLLGVSTKHLGKGLGLSNAYEQMKIIGGSLVLHSEVGVGTRVELIFVR